MIIVSLLIITGQEASGKNHAINILKGLLKNSGIYFFLELHHSILTSKSSEFIKVTN